ncbi:hypothetical protein AB1K70_07625 [Bremerella sp. JC770]|uniref:hypothetical protein n=1 Tax=Bremerella sp. JC770 TaxID=3232137 RepID=UPI003459BBD7
MIRSAPLLASFLLLTATLSASAQDFTTQDPRYTTTPEEYTTTPEQYTTTPSQYTTTPAEYLPQAGTTLPDIDVPLPDLPDDVTDVVDDVSGITQVNDTNVEAFAAPQLQQTALVEGEQESLVIAESEVVSETEPAVELVAAGVLQLDEEETQQFIDDYNEVLVDLGLEAGDIRWSTKFKIVLYLALRKLLGLDAEAADLL